MSRKWPPETKLLRARAQLSFYLCEQPRKGGVQRPSYAGRRPDSDIPSAALNGANVGLVEADSEGEFLLGVALLDAEPPYQLPEPPS